MSDTKTPPEPIKTKTEWTPKGYRLDVWQWSESIMLTCETSGVAAGGGGESFAFLLGRIVIIPGSLRPDAERFVAHCLAFYDDPDLVEAGRKTVAAFFNGLKPSSAKVVSIPPTGGQAN